MTNRKNSYQALVTLSEALRYPLRGLVQHFLQEKVRGLLEHAPAQDRADLPFSHEGGMVDFMIAVHTTAQQIRNGLGWTANPEVSDHSIYIVSLLHPVARLTDWDGQKYYLPKFLADKTRSEKAPWRKNPDLYQKSLTAAKTPTERLAKTLLVSEDHAPDGLKSLAIVETRWPELAGLLSADERHAIRFAAGVYELGEASRLFGKESRLQQIIHTARILALRGLT